MLDDVFESAYRRLVSAFGHYHDTPRRPDTVPALGAARWQLHLARDMMSQQRTRVTTPTVATKPAAHVDVTDRDLARLRVSGIGNEF